MLAQELSEPYRSWRRNFWALPLVAQEFDQMWLDFASVKVWCLKLGFLQPFWVLLATLRSLQEHVGVLFTRVRGPQELWT